MPFLLPEYRLQYISRGASPDEQQTNIFRALDAGCRWIQLRCKETPEHLLKPLAESVLVQCHTYQAVCILNDFPQLARLTGADGVHLGRDDMPLTEARAILPHPKIIGATANTKEDLQQHIAAGCDYIGLGPYRFTQTKKALSPILGLEGYKTLLQTLPKRGRHIPIFAIGGVDLPDIPRLLEAGCDGIAISGLLHRQANAGAMVRQIYQYLNQIKNCQNNAYETAQNCR